MKYKLLEKLRNRVLHQLQCKLPRFLLSVLPLDLFRIIRLLFPFPFFISFIHFFFFISFITLLQWTCRGDLVTFSDSSEKLDCSGGDDDDDDYDDDFRSSTPPPDHSKQLTWRLRRELRCTVMRNQVPDPWVLHRVIHNINFFISILFVIFLLLFHLYVGLMSLTPASGVCNLFSISTVSSDDNRSSSYWSCSFFNMGRIPNFYSFV